MYMCMYECVHVSTHAYTRGQQKTTSSSLNRHRPPFYFLFWDRVSHSPVREIGLPVSSGGLLILLLQHVNDWVPSPAVHWLPQSLPWHLGRQCLAAFTSLSQALGTDLWSTLVLPTFFFSVLWIIMPVNEWLSNPLPSLGLSQMHVEEINKQKENEWRTRNQKE